VELDIRLVTKLRRAAGKGSRQVTIARRKIGTDGSATRRVRIRPARNFRQRLRKRDVAQARLVVIATDREGNRRKSVKPVRFS
jgi:hypothetical protein